jgi:transcriptional regulator with PAS, ATPase and Fis domain
MIDKIVEIFKNMNNAVILVNPEGKIIFSNNKAEVLLKTGGESGLMIYDVLPETKLMDIMKHDYIEKESLMNINGHMCLTTRTPIHDKDTIIGAMAVFDDVTHLEQLNKQLDTERNTGQILKHILELAYDGIVVVDKNGIITMISDAYRKFLNIGDHVPVIGKHVTQVIANTRMHIVAQTDLSEINQFQEINGHYMMASRIPYYIDGEVAGAIGKVVFRDVSEIKKISEDFEKINSELDSMRSEVKKNHRVKYDLDSIVTQNYKVMNLKFHTKKMARSNSNVLILGESGTGKELFAQAVHSSSERKNMPFVSVNCAAIPDALLEAELFGYEPGAFTGASREGKVGKFEIADRGTIFLDEIADMPLKMQAKILRVIQENEVEKIGSNNSKTIDIRVIAATNKNIYELIENKEFREDLFYRLNVFQINLPPLRDRKNDIMLIAEKFIDSLNYKLQKSIEGFSSQAKSILISYHWPGNVRELKNIVERAYNIIEKERVIQPWHLPAGIRAINHQVAETSEPLKVLMEETEKKIIMDRLLHFNGNKTKTAQDLGISRVAFHKKLSKYELV